ncbi:MAG: hypothetical protein HY863_00095 [Chloroflexi bacterium]|nr:hypothetical protein [Chloroflexota bacterium]
MNKITFLPRLQRERDKFELLLNQVGFSRRMTMKGVSGSLSIKDLLADILSREEFIADRLNEILHGEAYAPCTSHSALDKFQDKFGYPDYESPLLEKDNRNHTVTYKHKNIGVDDIVEQELAAYENIISALEKLTHDQCLDHDLFHRVAEHTYKPYRRASLEINRWLKSIATESN